MKKGNSIAWVTSCASGASTKLLSDLLVGEIEKVQEVAYCPTDDSTLPLVESVCAEASVPVYNLDQSEYRNSLIELALQYPGVVCVHDAFSEVAGEGIVKFPAQLAEQNVLLFIDQQHGEIFKRKHPQASVSWLPLPIQPTRFNSKKTAKSVCFSGGVRVEENAHRLLAACSRIGSEVVLRWLVNSEELDFAEQLVADYEVPVRFYLDRNAEHWRDICETSEFAAFLNVGGLWQSEPYLLISLNAGCQVITADRDYRYNYPEGLLLRLPLAADFEEQFSQVLNVPTGEWRQNNAIENHLRTFHAVQYVLEEFMCTVNNVAARKGESNVQRV